MRKCLPRRTFGANALAGNSGRMFGRVRADSALVAFGALPDMNGSIPGTPVELISADHRNKPDFGVSIAR